MSDYRLIIRAKNNLLYGRMEKHGSKSQSELARVLGVSSTQIGDVANLRVGALNADGSLSKATEEDIYPPEGAISALDLEITEQVAGFYDDPLGLVYWAFDWSHGGLEKWQIELLTGVRERIRAESINAVPEGCALPVPEEVAREETPSVFDADDGAGATADPADETR